MAEEGGYNLGGGYVTVGVDLSGARQELAAFKQELGSYFAGAVMSPVGGGGLGAGIAAPAGGTQQGGAAGLPPVGMPTAGGFAGFAGMPTQPPGVEPYTVNDFSGGGAFDMMPVGTTLWSMTNQPAAAPGWYGGEGGMGMSLGGAGGGGGTGGRGGRGGGGGRGPRSSTGEPETTPWWMKNLFRPSTLFQQLGAPVGAFYGMETLGHVMSGFAQSNYIAQHPEINREAMSQVGSGLGLYNDPSYQGLVDQSQNIDETLAMRQSLYGMPLLGGYLQAFDFGEGGSFELGQRRARIGEEAGRRAETAGMERTVRGIRAELTGDPVAAKQNQINDEIRAKQEVADQAQRAAGLAYTAMQQSRPTDTYSWGEGSRGYVERGSPDPEKTAAYNSAADAAQKAAAALNELKDATAAQVNEVRRQQGNAAAEIRAGTAVTAASTFGGQFDVGEAQIGALRTSLDTALSNYDAKPTNVNLALGVHAQTALDSAGAAQKQALYDTLRLGGLAFDDSFAASKAGSYDRSFQYGVAQRSQAASIRAAALSASNDPYGAQLADIDAGRERAHGMPPIQSGLELVRLDAQESVVRARHTFEMGVFEDTMAARRAADDDLVSHRPLTSQARTAVASAMSQVANAPKAERETLIDTLQKDLQTQKIMLTQQLGGQVAVDVNAYTAMGMPSALGLDLTGRQMDVSHAQGVYDNANLHNARNAATGQNPDAGKTDGKGVGDIYDLLIHWKPVGVTMFR